MSADPTNIFGMELGADDDVADDDFDPGEDFDYDNDGGGFDDDDFDDGDLDDGDNDFEIFDENVCEEMEEVESDDYGLPV